jgi:hypothetical protein
VLATGAACAAIDGAGGALLQAASQHAKVKTQAKRRER